LTDYRVESFHKINTDELDELWLDLQLRADCSYFQSWGWMQSWLRHVVSDINYQLIKVTLDEVVVGLGVFTENEIRRRGFVASRAMYLNEYPCENKNMIIEYNGLLADKEHKHEVYREVINYLDVVEIDNDEFFFSGVEEDELSALKNNSSIKLNILEESSTWSIDLDSFEAGVDAYLATLSKNRRAQIKRSLKLYEAVSPLKIDEAASLEEALLFFEGLKKLHTSRWSLKGAQGSFANSCWEGFHKALITSRYNEGEIQLLKVSNQEEIIGYLYNFLWRGRAYVLQTGFKMSEDKRLMPGYVVHVLAIAHNKSKGLKIYDFMHGDSLYKKILCNQSQKLYWAVLQRRKIRFLLENAAVSVVRGARRLLP